MHIPEQFKHAPTLYALLMQTTDNWRKVGHYSIIEMVVLASGVSFETVAQPSEMDAMKECFSNAASLVLGFNGKKEVKDLAYVEGYVWKPGLPFPIHHAWCVTKDRKVYDTTMRNQDGAEYIGVEIDKKILTAELLKNEVYGLFDCGAGYNIEFLRKISPSVVAEAEKFWKEESERRKQERLNKEKPDAP